MSPLDEIKTRAKPKKYPDGIIKHTINTFGQNFKVFSKFGSKDTQVQSNSEEQDPAAPILLNTPLSMSSASPSPLSSTSASSTSSASNQQDFNTPKAPPFPFKPHNLSDSREEKPVSAANKKSFKRLVQLHSDFLVSHLKSANLETYNQDGSSSACTTPTSSQSTTTTTPTIKTSPKLGRTVFHSKETINSFDMDYNSSPSKLKAKKVKCLQISRVNQFYATLTFGSQPKSFSIWVDPKVNRVGVN